MRRVMLLAGILILGAIILSPMVAAVGFDRVPGDIAFRMGNTPVNIPVAYSLCASVGLALLYKILKR
jgi:Protein of unknown function (DUF2905)